MSSSRSGRSHYLKGGSSPPTPARACSSARLERTPDKREVGSSSLPRPTTQSSDDGVQVTGIERGAVAQLGERLLCKQEVVGSIPSSSTNYQMPEVRYQNGVSF